MEDETLKLILQSFGLDEIIENIRPYDYDEVKIEILKILMAEGFVTYKELVNQFWEK